MINSLGLVKNYRCFRSIFMSVTVLLLSILKSAVADNVFLSVEKSVVCFLCVGVQFAAQKITRKLGCSLK